MSRPSTPERLGALQRERERLSSMYDAALAEVAEASADMKQAEQEYVRIYAEVHGVDMDEARRRVRMEVDNA